jgi:hypothetical protein
MIVHTVREHYVDATDVLSKSLAAGMTYVSLLRPNRIAKQATRLSCSRSMITSGLLCTRFVLPRMTSVSDI